jgi:endonuclease III
MDKFSMKSSFERLWTLVELPGVGNLAAHMALREASLWKKRFQMN